jgi:hypothetical protein
MVASSSSAWVPGSDAATPSSYVTGPSGGSSAGKRLPWVWVSVGGVALAFIVLTVVMATRSHPKTVATDSLAPSPRVKTENPPADVRPTNTASGVPPVAVPAPLSNAASAPTTTTVTTAGRVVNLLTLVDPARDTKSGTWRLRTGELAPELTSDATQHARINIPYDPPEEYDFRVDFTRVAGDNCMTQIFTHQKPCCLVLYGWKGTISGFQQIGGQSADRNPTGVRGLTTENGQRHTSIVKVRKNALEAWLDGQLITRYETDGADLSSKDWAVDKPLGLGSQLSPTTFHRVELTEISGPARASN